MEQELTCINCPLGCRMTADVQDGEVVRVTGNSCKRGETYARQECVRPMRTLTASAPVAGSRCPVSVKTSCPIPRERIDDCMERAWACLNAPGLPHDAYHAFTLSKCIPAFYYFGYFLYAKKLRERMAMLHEGT